MRGQTTTHGVLVAALAAVVAGVSLLALLNGFSTDPALKTLEVLAIVCLGAILIGGTIVFVLIYLADWRSPVSDDDFELIVKRAEELAARDRSGQPYQVQVDDGYDYLYGHRYNARELGLPDGEIDAEDDAEFRALVRAAVDELPSEFITALEHVAIVVSDGGAAVSVGGGRHGAYGLYQGDTVARDYFHDRIIIFRDTLVRDFGHDPELLRAQVTRTVRHELAHHLGWDENGVRRLGL